MEKNMCVYVYIYMHVCITASFCYTEEKKNIEQYCRSTILQFKKER